jgi:protein tyrosine phosphatase
MGSLFTCFHGEEQAPPNKESYSCIPKIENNYKDISYNSLKNEINKHIKSIKRKNENNKFSYNNYEYEFSLLEKNIDDNEAHYDELEEGIQELCRYSDIKTYKHNNLEINTESKYINASPIRINEKIVFISTQGPKPNTIEDFWVMVEQYNSKVIIMLCNLMEGNREKCANYWDANNTLKKYSINFNEKTTEYNTIVEREIKLKNNSTNSEKSIIQIHYKGWPDHGAPKIEESFNDFLYIIKKVDEIKGDGDEPIVVHCSAGVGRTGAFISMYFLYKEIMAQIKDESLEKINFSVFNMVRKLKEMRLYMVQSVVQYKFIYDFVDCLLKKYNK